MFGTEKVEGLLFRQFFCFYLFHSKVFIVKFQFLWFNIIQKKLSNFFQQFKGWLSNFFQQFKGWQGMVNELQGMAGAILRHPLNETLASNYILFLKLRCCREKESLAFAYAAPPIDLTLFTCVSPSAPWHSLPVRCL